MKKLVLIAMLIAMVSPAMAVQIIPPSPSPSGSIPVMMTIDRFAEMLLPDQIVLVSADPESLIANWANLTSVVNIRANFNAEIQVAVVPRTSPVDYSGIGTWTLALTAAGQYGVVTLMGDYATILLTDPGATVWDPLTIGVTLSGVDLTSASYSPTAVAVADVTITVVSQ